MDLFPFFASCLIGAGAFGWWLKAKRVRAHICEMAPQVLTPWLPPDLEADFPSRNYCTATCTDKSCKAEIIIPVQIGITHKNGAVIVNVTADSTNVAAHELEHEWNA